MWPHLDSIRKLRLARRTWAQVAEAIDQAGGPKVAASTCLNFYKRAVKLSRKGKLPLGFVDPFATQPAPAPPQPPTVPVPPSATSTPFEDEDPLLRIEEPPKEESINERKLRLFREQREKEQREKR